SLYSSSERSRHARRSRVLPSPPQSADPATKPEQAPNPPPPKPASRWRRFVGRYSGPLMALAGVLLTLALVAGHQSLRPAPRVFTQEDIDAAVLHTLETKTIPSPMAQANDAMHASRARRRALGPGAVNPC